MLLSEYNPEQFLDAEHRVVRHHVWWRQGFLQFLEGHNPGTDPSSKEKFSLNTLASLLPSQSRKDSDQHSKDTQPKD